jgi:hypothetical protein
MSNKTDAKFKVFMAVKIQAEVFQVVMTCSVIVGYQPFEEPCYLHLQGEENGAGKGKQI